MLTEAICYVCEAGTSFEDFAETTRSFMESIAGLETLTEPEASSLVNQLWSVYMAKKPSKAKQAEKSAKKGKKDAVQEASEASAPKQPEAKVAPKQAETAAEPKKIDLDKPAVKQAIDEGQAILKEGKSKADAAWAIYCRLKDEDKDLIVAAFIKGATLTEKGALTYWYNCKRRAAKEAPAK
jgi:pyruvate/2-oxoglutarate dehydrogenase complex dihydrolipoamide acyltransferase (E2) component